MGGSSTTPDSSEGSIHVFVFLRLLRHWGLSM